MCVCIITMIKLHPGNKFTANQSIYQLSDKGEKMAEARWCLIKHINAKWFYKVDLVDQCLSNDEV